MTKNRIAAAILLAATVAGPALGHSWYDPACCSERDCEPARDGDVVETKDGWFIKPLGVTVPFGAARPSADDHFHFCRSLLSGNLITAGGQPCLYVPPHGI